MMKMQLNKFSRFLIVIIISESIFISSCIRSDSSNDACYVAGDFHQHTTYSGGDYSIGHVMKASDKYDLDWWANSDHGGTRELWGKASGLDYGSKVSWESTGIKLLGDKGEPGDDGLMCMWRWQSLKYYNFEDILIWRRVFPDKLILQGFEWNVPGHQHANVSIIANQFPEGKENCDPLAQFEYMFDDDDEDTTGGLAYGWKKSNLDGKEKAREAVKWLQDNYPQQSYMIPSHPDKSGDYHISDFRDFNNLAPDVCFGFDGMPGHQKNPERGGYDPDEAVGAVELNSKGGATFGGAGVFMAKVGGVWDAMLSEGRRWWVSASSDFHDEGDFYPGEYQKTYTFVSGKNDPQALIDGMRSGNTFIVTGELISELNFTVGKTFMGQTLKTEEKKVIIEIRILDPDKENFNTYSDYTNPELDHFDIIAGKVSGLISPGSPEYTNDYVSTTKVIARFDGTGGITDSNGLVSQKWKDMGDGWKKVTYEAEVEGKMYFRLRGTNHPLNTPEELDQAGNPLPDFAGENSAEKAFSDLWFYSNPVFVDVTAEANNNLASASSEKSSTYSLSKDHKWYRGNTHTHATFSDENDTNDVPEIAGWYRDAGYDFLLLSEHNDHVADKKIFTHDEASVPPGFIMLNGLELSNTRHHTALGIESYIGDETSLKDGVSKILAAGGMPILNHPQDPVVTSKDFLAIEGLNHLEVFNGGRPQDTPPTEMLWDSLLSSPKGRVVYAVASDDNHYKKANAGRGWIMVDSPGLTKKKIVENIRTGNFYASTGIIITDYNAGKNIVKIDTENGEMITFIGENGSVLYRMNGNSATYNFSGNELYVRAKITNSEGMAAWTQPVFIK
jgi:hypothetical protein